MFYATPAIHKIASSLISLASYLSLPLSRVDWHSIAVKGICESVWSFALAEVGQSEIYRELSALKTHGDTLRGRIYAPSLCLSCALSIHLAALCLIELVSG